MKFQAQSKTERERLLLVLFPTAAILAVYSVVLAVPLQRTKLELETELRHQKSIAVSPSDAQDSFEIVKNNRQSLERLKKRIFKSRQQIRELSQSWRSQESRLETREMISELMRDHELSIVSLGDEENLIVSDYLRGLFEMMDKQSPSDEIKLWQVRIQGSYGQVTSFLKAVHEKANKVVPVGITMKTETPGSPRMNWTIVFAI